MRYLGIDFGEKNVGLALSDEAGTMGFPHTVLHNSRTLLDEVRALIVKEGVGAVVIGESRNYRGEENPIAPLAKAFGDALARDPGTPIFYQPEVLTTAEARRALVPEEKSRAPKSHEQVDASAAALILTSYLNTHGNAR